MKRKSRTQGIHSADALRDSFQSLPVDEVRLGATLEEGKHWDEKRAVRVNDLADVPIYVRSNFVVPPTSNVTRIYIQPAGQTRCALLWQKVSTQTRQIMVIKQCQPLALKSQSTSSARLTRGNSYGGASLESVNQNAGSRIVATSE